MILRRVPDSPAAGMRGDRSTKMTYPLSYLAPFDIGQPCVFGPVHCFHIPKLGSLLYETWLSFPALVT